MVRDWLDHLEQLIYPPTCLLCGGAGDGRDLCRGCLGDLPCLDHGCQRCALPMAAPAVLCGQCLQRPPPFDRTVAAFAYGPPIDRLVTGLKFHGRMAYARLLGELLGERVAAADGALPERILVVPLHRARLRSRGFNQAMEIARPIARRLGLPVMARGLVRARATRAQTELQGDERRRNLRGAFAATPGLDVRDVALVDDVMTTGATAAEAARALKAAGVERVRIWCVARVGQAQW